MEIEIKIEKLDELTEIVDSINGEFVIQMEWEDKEHDPLPNANWIIPR